MSLTEILVILAVILMVVGPERIPALARKLGRTMREVRRASNFFRDAFMLEDDLPEPPSGADLDIVDSPSPSDSRATRDPSPTATPPSPDPDDEPASTNEPRFDWIDLPPGESSDDLTPVSLSGRSHSDLVRSRPLPYPLITH